MTHCDYSKPSADIAVETEGWVERDKALLEHQKKLAQHLLYGEERKHCLLCSSPLDASPGYKHREIDYLFCGQCDHLQTRIQPPDDYPYAQSGSGFEAINPVLNAMDYKSRRDRIYLPKLDWILSKVELAGFSIESALASNWPELGCGAGYFLHALQAKGAHKIIGIDGSAGLVAEANRHCGKEVAYLSNSILDDLEASREMIIAAFFVLEHIEDAARLWHILSNKPSGTLFAFAVPTFGLSTITEGAFDGFAARNLDSGVHTQLYTDHSINYALEKAGYHKVSEWLFGQDAQDICRLLLQRIEPKMHSLLAVDLSQRLKSLVDPLQQVIDRSRLCDARHVLAVKS